MERLVQPKVLLILVAMLACMVGMSVMRDQFGISVTRATAVLCAFLSPCVYAAGCLTSNPWLKRIGIALIPTAVIMWLVNSDLIM
jgi:hypothetical protein